MTKVSKRHIRVVAPATLIEGYQFDVNVDGKAITVKVPVGGVEKGEAFDIPYPLDEDKEDETIMLAQGTSTDEEEDTVPQGRWRRSLCSCCDVLTQATFFMGFCCLPVMIAQLLTRLKLNCWGKPAASEEEAGMSFNRIVISAIIFLLIGYIPVVGYVIGFGYIFFVVVWIGGNLRKTMREKYKIPPSLCYDCCDDSLCMCLCPCCSTIQMARHTHNDREYPGYCCTTDGLEAGAPKIV